MTERPPYQPKVPPEQSIDPIVYIAEKGGSRIGRMINEAFVHYPVVGHTIAEVTLAAAAPNEGMLLAGLPLMAGFMQTVESGGREGKGLKAGLVRGIATAGVTGAVGYVTSHGPEILQSLQAHGPQISDTLGSAVSQVGPGLLQAGEVGLIAAGGIAAVGALGYGGYKVGKAGLEYGGRKLHEARDTLKKIEAWGSADADEWKRRLEKVRSSTVRQLEKGATAISEGWQGSSTAASERFFDWLGSGKRKGEVTGALANVAHRKRDEYLARRFAGKLESGKRSGLLRRDPARAREIMRSPQFSHNDQVLAITDPETFSRLSDLQTFTDERDGKQFVGIIRDVIDGIPQNPQQQLPTELASVIDLQSPHPVRTFLEHVATRMTNKDGSIRDMAIATLRKMDKRAAPTPLDIMKHLADPNIDRDSLVAFAVTNADRIAPLAIDPKTPPEVRNILFSSDILGAIEPAIEAIDKQDNSKATLAKVVEAAKLVEFQDGDDPTDAHHPLQTYFTTAVNLRGNDKRTTQLLVTATNGDLKREYDRQQQALKQAQNGKNQKRSTQPAQVRHPNRARAGAAKRTQTAKVP